MIKIERTEPWICEGANEWLDKFFKYKKKKSLDILEFGMGASTLWFLKQEQTDTLTSVEHHEEYFNIVTSAAKESIKNGDFHPILQPTPYESICDTLINSTFDIILVDGRNRVRCIKASITKLKEGGILILDNSETHWYKPGIELMKDWKKITFLQPYPDKYGYTYPGWETTIFFK